MKMKIIKITKKKGEVYNILFNDNTSLNFFSETLIKYNLLKPRDLSVKEFEEIVKYNNQVEAYNKALKYISIKLRTKKEIEKKLQDYDKKIAYIVINKLEASGYLNDDLYIKSFIADQVNLTNNGPKKIIRELEKNNFEPDKILNVLDDYDEEIWVDKITKVINKKVKGNHNLGKKALLNKIKNDLINLGYESNLINNVLSTISIEVDKGIIEKEYNKAFNKFSRKYDGYELKNKIKYTLLKKGFDLEDIESIINKQ